MVSCHFPNGVLEEQRFFILMKSNFQPFYFMVLALGAMSKKVYLSQGYKDFHFCFLLENLEFLTFTLTLTVHFKLTFR